MTAENSSILIPQKDVILTSEQCELIEKLVQWRKTFNRFKKPYFSYSGRAGTGKTTVIKKAIEQMGLSEADYLAAAYVGKAVLVLLRHGLPASTIHSLIYFPSVEEIKPFTEQNPTDHVIRKMVFKLRAELQKDIKLLIIDEATMVNDQMKEEILSFGIPTVFIGDMNQLPPVFGISSVMAHPDFVLTQIMRQALDNPIIQIADDILEDVPLEYGTYGSSKIIPQIDINLDLLKDYDIIICGTNRTRSTINQHLRKLMGIDSNIPVMGEKLICRQNNWNIEIGGIYLTNGTIGNVTDINRAKTKRHSMRIDFRPDFLDEDFHDLDLDLDYIKLPFEEQKEYGISRFNKFEYGYAITTYLSQGSEYPRVLYIDEPLPGRDKTKKQRYTAVTRASESVTVVIEPQTRPRYNSIWDM